MKRRTPLRKTSVWAKGRRVFVVGRDTEAGKKLLEQGFAKLPRGKPLRRVGARAKREAPALAAARAEVLARCGATPERHGVGVCERCGRHATIEPHHKLRNPRVHDPKEMAGLCRKCHRGVETHAVKDWREWIRERR